MADVVVYIPKNSDTAEWRKTDQVHSDVNAKLERYCLCALKWKDDKHESLQCDTNKDCKGRACVFWVIAFDEVGMTKGDGTKYTISQDVKDAERFGQGESIKFGDDGNLAQSSSSRVLFCSCGTLAEIKPPAKRPVKPPEGDPPK